MKVPSRVKLLWAVIAIWTGLSGAAMAATQNINATATIATATVTLGMVQHLSFGTITMTPAGGTVTVDATGGAAVSTVSSGAGIITVAGQNGEVSVLSPVDATVNILYSVAGLTNGNPDVLDQAAGAAEMALTSASVHLNSTSGTNPGTLALTAATPASIYVGGVLQVGASQTTGLYSGVITVTVNY